MFLWMMLATSGKINYIIVTEMRTSCSFLELRILQIPSKCIYALIASSSSRFNLYHFHLFYLITFENEYCEAARSFCPINLVLFIEFPSRLFIWSPCENAPTFCRCSNNKYRESPPCWRWRPTLREDLLVRRLNISYYVNIINGNEHLVNSSYNTINCSHIQLVTCTREYSPNII